MQVRGEKDYISLARGLITERSPIVGEEQACKDELNCLFDSSTNSRVKRRGLRSLGSYNNEGPNAPVFVVRHHWEEHNLFVDVYRELTPRAGGALHTIVRVLSDTAPYTVLGSADLFNFHSTLPGNTRYTISSNSQFLLIGGGSKIFALSKSGASTVEVYSVTVYIRDFKLLPDGLTVSQRPTTLTDEHKYNLYNAGWYALRRHSAGALVDPVTEFHSPAPHEYPSNADIAVLGLRANSSGTEIFSKDTLVETVNGSTVAPRGHYVYDSRFITRDTRLGDKFNDGVPPSTLYLEATITW